LTSDLFEDMLSFNITLKELVVGYNSTNTFLDKIEEEDSELYSLPNEPEYKWTQIDAARTVLELVNDDYFNERKSFIFNNTELWREKLKNLRTNKSTIV
jgi:hypothetical protein